MESKLNRVGSVRYKNDIIEYILEKKKVPVQEII
jgi:hypothetical protein